MAKQKEDRFATCGDMARAARAALGVRGGTTGAQSPVARATETVLAAPPSGTPPPPPIGAPAPPIPMPTAATTLGSDVGAPPPQAPMTPVRAEPGRPGPPSGGNRKGLLLGGIAAAVIAAGVVGFLVLGGGDDNGEPNGGVTGGTGDRLQFSSLLADDFSDNDAGWEQDPQNGIDRFPSLNERYRFEITDQAPENAFAVSVGGALGQDVLDQGVGVTTTLVQKGGGGLLNSFGVTCRYTGRTATTS
jgi:hypothetical protein